jgi:hypothetical protein
MPMRDTLTFPHTRDEAGHVAVYVLILAFWFEGRKMSRPAGIRGKSAPAAKS